MPTSSNSVIGRFRFLETGKDDGSTNMALETFKTNTDEFYGQWMVRRILADGTWSAWSGFQIGVHPNGNPYVYMKSDAIRNAWRDELSLSN